MMFSFALADVIRPVRVDAQHAVVLSVKIQRRAPAVMSPAARIELAALKSHTDKLDADLSGELLSQGRVADTRPLGYAARNAWGALYNRLDVLRRLDGGDVPQAAQAVALVGEVFPGGLDYFSGDFETLWLNGQHTLEVIDQLAHSDAIEELAGDFVLRAVRARHHTLGVALGLAGSVHPPAEEPSEPVVDRRTLLDNVTLSIARFAHHITAIDTSDAAAVKAAEHALEPLVKLRAKLKASRGADEDTTDEDAADKKTEPVAQPSTVTRGAPANDADATKRNVA